MKQCALSSETLSPSISDIFTVCLFHLRCPTDVAVGVCHVDVVSASGRSKLRQTRRAAADAQLTETGVAANSEAMP